MNRIVALVFVIAGSVLSAFGFEAYGAVNGSISHALTGGSSDSAVWLIIAGLLAAITGFFGFGGDHSEQS